MSALGLHMGVALLVLTFAGATSAADEAGWSYELGTQLMSPYCPGRTLVDCPSAQAAELRAWIEGQEAQGRTRQEVEEQLYARFGDVVRQAPDPRGFGLAAYLIPAAALLAGGALVVVFLRRQTRAAERVAETESARVGPVDPELERLLDQELEGR